MYRILRDNKEKGPISLEELLTLSLKPFDLIWVEGKSAGWRYPSEIDSLKSYMGEEPTGRILSPQSHPASQDMRIANTNESLSASPVTIHDETISEDEELTAEKLERKAAEIYKRVQAYSEKSSQQQQGVQTKYAKSLDDLKQEYADWLHHKKGKKGVALPSMNKKSWMGMGGIGLALLVILFFIFWAPRQDKKFPVDTGKNYVSNAVSGYEAKAEHPVTDSLDRNEAAYSEPLQKMTAAPEQSSVDRFIDSVRRVLAMNGKKIQPKKKSARTMGDTPIQLLTLPVAGASESEIPAPKKETIPARQVNLNARYNQDGKHRNVSSLEITVQNTGAELLSSVTVDVFYYKKGERLFDKETVYFNNIHPGNSITLSLPGNKKAVSARFQLGQINGLKN